jgi:hypothetical protein
MLVTVTQAAPIFVVAVALTLVAAALLLFQKQRQRPDFIGRVKSDAYHAMIRALILLLIGLLLALGTTLVGSLPFAETLKTAALALIAIGAVAFIARLALYALRIKPQLDRMGMTAGRPDGESAKWHNDEHESQPLANE